MSAERLQRILARSGWGSRRAAEEAVREGRVTINGQVAELGAAADPETDSIKVDGRRVRPPKSQRYLLLNKPMGCVSTKADPEGRATVMDLLPPRMRGGVVPVGRLDFNSEGLLLLTDDGDLAQRLAHPRYGCSKTYRVKVSGRPTEEEIERLRRGIVLDGKRTRPCAIRFVRATGRAADSNSWWEVVLTEGRTRQIRDMFFRVRHSVLKLQRVAIGSLRDAKLPRGAWRALSVSEVEQLRQARPAELPENLGASRPVRRSVGSEVPGGLEKGEKSRFRSVAAPGRGIAKRRGSPTGRSAPRKPDGGARGPGKRSGASSSGVASRKKRPRGPGGGGRS